MSRDRIVIIGSGIAGAATAYFLTRKGAKDVVIIEKEKIAGVHATGLNAAILRSFIPTPLINRIACESADFYRNPPEGFSSEPLVDPVGVYLAARAEHAETLQKWRHNNPESGLQQSDATPVYEQIPILAPGLVSAAYKPDDGVLDVHAILQGFLRGATKSGAEVCYGREFKSLQTKNGMKIGDGALF